jgi:hypothetical protein
MICDTTIRVTWSGRLQGILFHDRMTEDVLKEDFVQPFLDVSARLPYSFPIRVILKFVF